MNFGTLYLIDIISVDAGVEVSFCDRGIGIHWNYGKKIEYEINYTLREIKQPFLLWLPNIPCYKRCYWIFIGILRAFIIFSRPECSRDNPTWKLLTHNTVYIKSY